ncbi:MAG: carbohydrate porin [Halanaerobacter sp.]
MKTKFSIVMLVALVVVLTAVPVFAETKVESAGEDGKVNVTFIYDGNLDANAAFVAGEMNNWSPNHPMWKMEKKDGVWQTTKKLDQGEKYQYKFTVYGGGELKWVKDEDAATFESDGFGGENSVLIAKTSVDLEPRVRGLEKKMATVNQGFEYHGYARSGYGLSADGGAVNQPGIGKAYGSFRLGNEFGTYVESIFSKKFTSDDGTWMKGQFLYAQSNGSDNNYDAKKVAMRESFVEGGGFEFAPELTFWAGQRFYGRTDVHITDDYWRDMSGYGAGVKGINAGPGELAIALVNTSEGEATWDTPEVGENSQQNLDIRLSDITVPGGKLELELHKPWSEGTSGDSDDDLGGMGIAAVYDKPTFYGVLDGTTKVGFQYGTELAGTLGKASDWRGNEDLTNMRFITYGVGDLSNDWDVMPLFQMDLTDDGSDETTKVVTGARFTNYMTDHFAMQYELGYDYAKADSADDAQTVTKMTVAPTLKWNSNSFWARPELRTFVTYANPDNRGFGDGVGREDGEAAVSYGAQMELWW